MFFYLNYVFNLSSDFPELTIFVQKLDYGRNYYGKHI